MSNKRTNARFAGLCAAKLSAYRRVAGPSSYQSILNAGLKSERFIRIEHIAVTVDTTLVLTPEQRATRDALLASFGLPLELVVGATNFGSHGRG